MKRKTNSIMVKDPETGVRESWLYQQEQGPDRRIRYTLFKPILGADGRAQFLEAVGQFEETGTPNSDYRD